MSLLDFSIVRWIQRYSVQSGHSRILLHLGLVTALAASGVIATSVESSGHFFPQVKQADGTMGPAPDYAYGRRHLCYEISERMGRDTNFSSWVRQAVANWNSVSSKTGWKFVPCKKGDKPNVRFDFADKTDGRSTPFSSSCTR
jgi:predicted DNA-binding ribbon-helix-helix protein